WNFPDFTDDVTARVIHFTFRLQMTYLFLNKEEAEKIIVLIEDAVDETPTLIITPDYYYYYCLWMAKQVDWGDLTAKVAIKKINTKLKALKKWATLNPANYLHKYLLIEAENRRLKKQYADCLPYYLRALEHAEKN